MPSRTVTLDTLARQLHRQRAQDHDLYARLGRLRLVSLDVPSCSPLQKRLGLLVEGERGLVSVRFRSVSLEQFLSYLGIPIVFARRIPAELVVTICNRLLAERADELALLRLKGREPARLRAILRPSFCRLGDEEILAAVRDLPEAKRLQVAHARIVDDYLHVRLVDPSLKIRVDARGDTVLIGLSLYHSETGQGFSLANVLLHRVVCSNGLTLEMQTDRIQEVKLKRLDGERTRARFRESLAWSAAHLGELTDRYRASRTVPLPDPDAELSTFLTTHRLGRITGRTGQIIRDRLQRERNLFGVTAFHLVQAVTEVSQMLETRQRLRYDRAAGEYLWGRMAA